MSTTGKLPSEISSPVSKNKSEPSETSPISSRSPSSRGEGDDVEDEDKFYDAPEYVPPSISRLATPSKQDSTKSAVGTSLADSNTADRRQSRAEILQLGASFQTAKPFRALVHRPSSELVEGDQAMSVNLDSSSSEGVSTRSTSLESNLGQSQKDPNKGEMENRSKVKKPADALMEPDDFHLFVKDLDTGKLVEADALHSELKSKGTFINPLSFQIYQRTGQIPGGMVSGSDDSGDEGHGRERRSSIAEAGSKTKAFFKQMKKKMSSTFMGDHSDTDSFESSDPTYVRVKTKRKSKKSFNRLVLVQELTLSMPPDTSGGSSPNETQPVSSRSSPDLSNSKNPNNGLLSPPSNGLKSKSANGSSSPHGSNPELLGENAIWVMKFNRDGRYLATAGQDAYIRIWVLVSEPTEDASNRNVPEERPTNRSSTNSNAHRRRLPAIFKNSPLRIYKGHKGDILDLSWSKNNFLLSSSMDKTVRLWHVSRSECLCCFQHADFVTSVAFHPRDDRFFLTGCLDCRIRLWNIPEKKVCCWNELPESNLITAVGFTSDGRLAIAGSYLGTCIFYEVDGLRYHTQIHVRSTRGKNSRGEKITGIEALPNQPPGEEKILITSNDSRIRLYNMRDKVLTCKYKGLENASSQIRATVSDDAQFILSGSEDQWVYIWKTVPEGVHGSHNSFVQLFTSESSSSPPQKSPNPGGSSTSSTTNVLSVFTNNRRDRNSAYETFHAHEAITTCALFAPSNVDRLLTAAGLRIGDDKLNSNEKIVNKGSDIQTAVNAAGQLKNELGPLKENEEINSSRFRSHSHEPSSPFRNGISPENGGDERSNQKPSDPSHLSTIHLRSKTYQGADQLGTASLDRRPKNQRNALEAQNSIPIMNTPPPPNVIPSDADGRIIVTADYRGCIRVWENERVDRRYYQSQPLIDLPVPANPMKQRKGSNNNEAINTNSASANKYPPRRPSLSHQSNQIQVMVGSQMPPNQRRNPSFSSDMK